MTFSAAFAPGTIANLCVGFDVLGLAVDGPGDLVSVDVTLARAPDGSLSDDAAIETARALAREEGIFTGISGGATLATALQVADQAAAGSVILAMLPDTGERYLSTPLFEGVNEGSDDEWLASL